MEANGWQPMPVEAHAGSKPDPGLDHGHQGKENKAAAERRWNKRLPPIKHPRADDGSGHHEAAKPKKPRMNFRAFMAKKKEEQMKKAKQLQNEV